MDSGERIYVDREIILRRVSLSGIEPEWIHLVEEMQRRTPQLICAAIL